MHPRRWVQGDSGNCDIKEKKLVNYKGFLIFYFTIIIHIVYNKSTTK